MYRLFFKETGYAPMNYFLHMKIDRACQLLLHTNMKINQVALKLGFDDPYYFSRIFKKIVGKMCIRDSQGRGRNRGMSMVRSSYHDTVDLVAQLIEHLSPVPITFSVREFLEAVPVSYTHLEFV